MGKSSKRRKGRGTAAKSLTLTYAQLEFLDGLDNASAWVRAAIDEIREIREGKKVVLDRPRPGERSSYWAQLVEKGLASRGKLTHEQNCFDQILRACLDLEEANEEAERLDKAAGGNGEKPFNDFIKPAYRVVRDIEKIIEDAKQADP